MLTIDCKTLPTRVEVKSCFNAGAIIVLQTLLSENKAIHGDEFIADFQDIISNSDLVERGFSETVLSCRGHNLGA